MTIKSWFGAEIGTSPFLAWVQVIISNSRTFLDIEDEPLEIPPKKP